MTPERRQEWQDFLVRDLGWPRVEARIFVFLTTVVVYRWRRFMRWVDGV